MTKKDTYLVYGLVTGVIVTAVTIVLSVTKPIYKGEAVISDIAYCVGILMNARAYSKANNGFVTFSDVFKSCIKASLIITAMAIIWGVVYLLINPPELQQSIELGLQKAMGAKHIDKKHWEDINNSINAIKIGLVVGIGVGVFAVGVIFSLLGTALVKKKGTFPSSEI